MELETRYYKVLLNEFSIHIKGTKSLVNGDSYTSNAKRFMVYLEEQGIRNFKYVTSKVMKTYSDYLITRPKLKGKGTLSVGSINDNFSTLRMLSIRLLDAGAINRGLPIPNNFRVERINNHSKKLSREILTTDEVKNVFDVCSTNLEKSLIALAYGCGLRRKELVNLSILKINWGKGIITLEKTKNNKIRTIPISDFFLKILKEYSIERLHSLAESNTNFNNVFIHPTRGKPLTGDQLNTMLKKLVKTAGIKKNITLHCLRHSIATHLIDGGETLDYVRRLLGHAFIDTSTIYAKRQRIKEFYKL